MKYYQPDYTALSDDELSKRLVDHNLVCIRLLHKYANNPMWCPPLAPEQRKEFDAMWQEAVRRNLHEQINAEVNRIIKAE